MADSIDLGGGWTATPPTNNQGTINLGGGWTATPPAANQDPLAGKIPDGSKPVSPQAWKASQDMASQLGHNPTSGDYNPPPYAPAQTGVSGQLQQSQQPQQIGQTGIAGEQQASAQSVTAGQQAPNPLQQAESQGNADKAKQDLTPPNLQQSAIPPPVAPNPQPPPVAPALPQAQVDAQHGVDQGFMSKLLGGASDVISDVSGVPKIALQTGAAIGRDMTTKQGWKDIPVQAETGWGVGSAELEGALGQTIQGAGEFVEHPNQLNDKMLMFANAVKDGDLQRASAIYETPSANYDEKGNGVGAHLMRAGEAVKGNAENVESYYDDVLKHAGVDPNKNDDIGPDATLGGVIHAAVEQLPMIVATGGGSTLTAKGSIEVLEKVAPKLMEAAKAGNPLAVETVARIAKISAFSANTSMQAAIMGGSAAAQAQHNVESTPIETLEDENPWFADQVKHGANPEDLRKTLALIAGDRAQTNAMALVPIAAIGGKYFAESKAAQVLGGGIPRAKAMLESGVNNAITQGGVQYSMNQGEREADPNLSPFQGVVTQTVSGFGVGALAESILPHSDERVGRSAAARAKDIGKLRMRALIDKTRAGLTKTTPEERADLLKRAERINFHLDNNDIDRAARAANEKLGDAAEDVSQGDPIHSARETAKDSIAKYLASQQTDQEKRANLAALARWTIVNGGRTPQEYAVAAHVLANTGKLPDEVSEAVAGDFNKDGTLSNSALTKDAQQRTTDSILHLRPSDVGTVVAYFRSQGVNPYVTTRGDVAIIGNQKVLQPIQKAVGEKFQGTKVTITENHYGEQGERGISPEGKKPGKGDQVGNKTNASGDATSNPEGVPAGQARAANQVATPRNQAVVERLQKEGVNAPVKSDGRVVVEANAKDGEKAIHAAANDAAESPENDRKIPTPAQKANGNYPKGKVLFTSPHGDIPVNIESPAGSIRKSQPGVKPAWSRKLTEHYGYIPGTYSADGEPVDVIVGRRAHDDTKPIFVMHQTKPDGSFDEPKVVLGANNMRHARDMYLKQYPQSMHASLMQGKVKAAQFNRQQFIDWIKSGNQDVPINPMSKQPMLAMRVNGRMDGYFKNGTSYDSISDTADKLNAKFGISLKVAPEGAGYRLTGSIPQAKMPAVSKALSREEGYDKADFNGHDVSGLLGKGSNGSGEEGALRAGKGGSDGKVLREPKQGAPNETVRNRLGRGGTGAGSGTDKEQEAPSPRWLKKISSDAPLYAKGKGKHPVSVVGVHYSGRNDLSSLDSGEAGTGSPGSEIRRYGIGKPKSLDDHRLYYYVRQSRDLPEKESVVQGSHAYETRLNNLYDVRSDPDGIIERMDRSGKASNPDALEEAIRKAGYDGFVRSGVANDTPVVKMIGKHNIPVKAVHGDRFIFGGERAEEKQTPAHIARDMKQAGASKEEIHAKTGWHEGKDGKWRFEIDDSKASMAPRSEWEDAAKNNKTSELPKLGDVYKHPDLYKHYPKLKDVKVKVEDDLSLGGAYTDPDENLIALGPEENYKGTYPMGEGYLDEGKPVHSELSVLTHEVQHMVQTHEGHARGGSPEEFKQQAKQKHSEIINAMHAAMKKALDENEKGNPEEAARLFESAKTQYQRDIAPFNDSHALGKTIHKMYEHLAGEVESRLSQARLKMSKEERAASFPESMEDTPREEQIVANDKQRAPLQFNQTKEETQEPTQLSWEAVPSTKLADYKWITDAPLDFRERYTNEVNRAIGPMILSGNHLAADTRIGYGGWKGDVNPSVQSVVRDANESDVRAAADVYGYATRQDGVAYHRPVYNGKPEEENAVDIDIGRPLNPAETKAMYDNITNALVKNGATREGAQQIAPVPTKAGVRFLNFSDYSGVSNEDAKAAIHSAAETLPVDEANVTDFHSEGDLIGNDWEESPNGEGYLSRLGPEGSSNLQRGLADRARAEVDRITEKYKRQAAVEGIRQRTTEEQQAHVDEISNHVAKIAKEWKHAASVEVVGSRDALPAAIASHLDTSIGDSNEAAGVYYGGKVYLVGDAIADKEHAEFTLAHEMLGHYGLRATFDDGSLGKLLDSIHADIKDSDEYKELEKTYNKAYAHMSNKDRASALTEEFLSNRAALQGKPSILQKVKAWFHGWARRAGLKSRWTDGDILSLMDGVAKNVRQGRASRYGWPGETATFHPDLTSQQSYTGAAGAGQITHRTDGSRVFDLDGLKATVNRSITDDGTAMVVSSASYDHPSDLLAVTRLAGEENKPFVLWPAKMEADLKSAGIPTEAYGKYVKTPASHVEGQPARFSIRNQPEDQQLRDRIDRVLAIPESSYSPWDRFQHWARKVANFDELKDSFTQANLDAFNAFRKAEEATNPMGTPYDASQSAWKMSWMSQNTREVMGAMMHAGVPKYENGSFVRDPNGKGLLDIFMPLYNQPVKGFDRMWEFYAMARRGDQLSGQVNPDGTSKEKLLTPDDIQVGLELGNKYPVMKQVFDDWQNFNHKLLDLAVERGNMTTDMADLWKQNDYVPFFRVADDGDLDPISHITGGLAVKSKRLTGSEQRVEPIIENIMGNTASVLRKVYKNEAFRRAAAIGQLAGTVERMPMAFRPIDMQVGEIEANLDKMGLFIGQHANASRGAKLQITPAQQAKWTEFFRAQQPVGKDVFQVMENGKPVYYKSTDPLFADSIGSLKKQVQVERWFKTFVGGPKNLFTHLLTLNPAFMARHLERQLTHTWVQSGENFNPFSHAIANAHDAYTNSKFMQDMSLAGAGGNEYYDMDDLRESMRSLGNHSTIMDTPRRLWRGYRKIGFVADQMNRMGIAKNVLERGGSTAEAAWQAQDLLNFRMHGSGSAMRYITTAVPLLNARVQGLYRILRGATGTDQSYRSRKAAFTSFLVKAGMLTAASQMLALKNNGDQRYERLPDDMKSNYWNFFIGDHHFAIAKPFEIGAIFATLPDSFVRYFEGYDGSGTLKANLLRVYENVFRLDLDPAVTTPIVEDLNNKDNFTQRPIVPEYMNKDTDPAAQVMPTTSPTSTEIARHMPEFMPDAMRSPMRLDHLLKGYLPGVGLYAMDVADAIMRATGHGTMLPSPRMAFPGGRAAEDVAGSMVGKVSTDPRNRYIDMVYQDKQKLDEIAHTIQEYRKQQDFKDADAYQLKHKTSYQYRGMLLAAYAKMRDYNKQEHLIYGSQTMTPDQKRQALDTLTKDRNRYLQSISHILVMADNGL